MKRKFRNLLFPATIFAYSVGILHAASGTWTNATTGGFWSDTANWSGGIVADGSGSTANFSTLNITADNTVHMDASHTLSSLTFADATTVSHNWILDNNGTAGNILTLDGAASISVTGTTAAGRATISTVIAGSAGLTKTGTGLLTLSGTNTYTGATTVSGGALVLTGTNATTSVAVGANVFSLNGASALLSGTAITATTGNVILGDGQTTNANVTFNGTARGTFVLGNNASWAGNLTVNASSTNGLSLTPGSTTTISGNIVNNGAGVGLVVRNDLGTYGTYGANIGAGALTISGIISGSGTFQAGVSTAGNIVTLTGTNTFTGGLNLQGGSQLIIGGAGSLGSGAYGGGIVFGSGAGTFKFNSSANQILSGNISGTSGAVSKDNTGTLTLTGANTYTGATTISGGTLSAGNIVVSGGNSHLGNATSTVTLGSAATQGRLSYTGNTATYTRGFTVGGAGGGRLDVTTSNQTLTVGTGNVTGTGLFTVGGAGNTTIASNLIHTGGLTKTDSGALTLSGANTYTGLTTVSAGTLVAGVANAINTGAVTVNGATAIYSLGTFNDSVGTVILDGDGQINSSTGVLTSTGSFEMKSGSVSAILAGSVALNKTTGGTVTLTGTNTYTGATNVTAGTLRINGSTHDSSAFTVGATGTLGGTGTIGGSLNVTGVLAPGASIESLATGSLTMNAGSSFAYEVGADHNADLLVANGILSLTDVTLDLDMATLANLGLNTWSSGDSLTLISYTGAAIASGFTGYADDTIYTFGSNNWLFDYNNIEKGSNFEPEATGGNYVTMTFVPEPSAAVLGGLGLLALLRRRRR